MEGKPRLLMQPDLDMRKYTITSAGPENIHTGNGILKIDSLYGDYSEWGPTVDGRREGYWTKKYKDVETVCYRLYKNGVPSCYEILAFPNGDPRIKYSGEPRGKEK